MNELTFNRLTKSVKFRRLKLWKEDIRYVIKYNIYNILNKLHILGRYSFKSHGESHGEEYPNPIYIETPLFSAKVVSRLYEERYEVIDYFFTKKSIKGDNTPNNVKKVVLDVRNNSYRCTYYLESRLVEVKVRLAGKVYDINSLPTVKVYLPPTYSEVSPTTPQEGRTVKYNFKDLWTLKVSSVVSTDDIDSEEVKHYYEHSCMVLKDMLERKTLRNFQVRS